MLLLFGYMLLLLGYMLLLIGYILLPFWLKLFVFCRPGIITLLGASPSPGSTILVLPE